MLQNIVEKDTCFPTVHGRTKQILCLPSSRDEQQRSILLRIPHAQWNITVALSPRQRPMDTVTTDAGSPLPGGPGDRLGRDGATLPLGSLQNGRVRSPLLEDRGFSAGPEGQVAGKQGPANGQRLVGLVPVPPECMPDMQTFGVC